MKGSDYLTLVLAGGQGKRLGMLTRDKPKPALTFGGVYHLIDFTLSNCRHSNVGSIGVITQYCHRDLDEYIGPGSQWRSSDTDAKITTLPPRNNGGTAGHYNGTADAILKNADYIERHNPKHILVLSGDHIYKMDYTKILEAHEKSGAAATIASMRVPMDEAPHFGIIDADRSDTITGFEEKPSRPKSSLASMGVYVFDWPILKRHLLKSNGSHRSGMDIGRDIIPGMLTSGEKLSVFRFGGYWRDVGNIYSLWQANMDLLSSHNNIDLYDDRWSIISRNNGAVPHYDYYSSSNGLVIHSLMSEGCVNRGKVTGSVISAGVEIGEDASVYDSVIMPGAKIGKGAFVINAIVGDHAVVDDYMSVSNVNPDGVYLDNCQGVSVVGRNRVRKIEFEAPMYETSHPHELLCVV
jgi:glucose-1-phosphate adenylyltransferase